MIGETFQLMFLDWLLAASFLFLLWLLHLRLKNASIVDPAWAFSLAMIACVDGYLGKGLWQRRLLVAGMVGVWGLRLSLHLLSRIVGQEEEGRYQQMRKDWQTHIGLKFLAFFQSQALLNGILSFPLALACMVSKPLNGWDLAGLLVWVVSVSGEWLADRQLKHFKADPNHHGQVCQVGLWRYSRHPNYFFEWLVWVSYFFLGLNGWPWGLLGVVAPSLMIFFLLRVTGIPATEEQALRSRGEAYRRYQESTSAFVPWFANTSKQ